MTTTSGSPFLRFAIAADFAARRHIDQRRKGRRGEPYVDHVLEVARLVAEAAGDEIDAVVAALLHDTVEDTGTTLTEVVEVFGERVAAIVAEVTDDKSLSKEERKRLQIVHAAQCSFPAKLVKLADKISNLRSLRADPPDCWTLARRRAYFDWAGAVVDAGLRGVNPQLEGWFDAARTEGIAALEEEERRNAPPLT
jgi:(p)ppGpp synthase/HD superfamily hydrolase